MLLKSNGALNQPPFSISIGKKRSPLGSPSKVSSLAIEGSNKKVPMIGPMKEKAGEY